MGIIIRVFSAKNSDSLKRPKNKIKLIYNNYTIRGYICGKLITITQTMKKK